MATKRKASRDFEMAFREEYLAARQKVEEALLAAQTAERTGDQYSFERYRAIVLDSQKAQREIETRMTEALALKNLWEEHKKRSQAEFAQSQNWTQGNVGHYLNGRQALNLSAALAFSKELNVPVESFSPRLAEDLERGYLLRNDSGTIKVARKTRSVPVVGTAQLGPDGYWSELEHPVGHGDGRVRFESDDENAYALRVVGDSMVPRIRPGEFVVIEPSHQVRPLDEVLVVTSDGRSMVKEFLSERDGVITLESVNRDHPRITLPRSQIVRMHYVQGIMKSTAFMPDE